MYFRERNEAGKHGKTLLFWNTVFNVDTVYYGKDMTEEQ